MRTKQSRSVARLAILTATGALAACGAGPTFREDVDFLKAHRETLVLTAPDGSGRSSSSHGFRVVASASARVCARNRKPPRAMNPGPTPTTVGLVAA